MTRLLARPEHVLYDNKHLLDELRMEKAHRDFKGQ